jgi:O-succinylhomoserine sulfhydrylase
VEAACTRAAKIADFLAGHPQISRVWYPARKDHPQHDLAMRQMTAGGTLVTFELAGGKSAAFRFMNALRLVAISNNLGDSRSMVTHPATTTHMRIGAEERARLAITDGVVRLSVGLEDVADLEYDLARGLHAATLQHAAE